MSALRESVMVIDQLDRIQTLLERTLAQREVTELWHNKRQLAEALGVSVRWVEQRMTEGLPHREIAGKRMFRLSEAETWLTRRGLLREVHR